MPTISFLQMIASPEGEITPGQLYAVTDEQAAVFADGVRAEIVDDLARGASLPHWLSGVDAVDEPVVEDEPPVDDEPVVDGELVVKDEPPVDDEPVVDGELVVEDEPPAAPKGRRKS